MNLGSIIFHPAKVSLKVLATLFKTLSAYCDVKNTYFRIEIKITDMTIYYTTDKKSKTLFVFFFRTSTKNEKENSENSGRRLLGFLFPKRFDYYDKKEVFEEYWVIQRCSNEMNELFLLSCIECK